MSEASGAARLAIDVGGTFTDMAVLDERQGMVPFDKVPTTPDDAARGVLDGFSKAGVEVVSVSYSVHGTTLALNALLTRTGARVALITTLGFRNVYELGRPDREVMYDLTYRKPPMLVPRRDVHGVRERMTFEGEQLVPLDEEEACRVAAAVRESGVEAVAVCFLHSYANPAHEEGMARILGDVAPELDVALPHRLAREYREYERTSTAVVDAYIKPITRRYLQHLVALLQEAWFGGRFLVTRSGGGAMTVDMAIEQPAHMVLSGPASGVIGATAFADLIGSPNLVTIDLGGTSLDASLIIGRAPVPTPGARSTCHTERPWVSRASFQGDDDARTPANEGNFRPLRVIAPPGSLMRAMPPSPSFTLWTGLLAGKVILKALAQRMPDLIQACSGGDVCSMVGWA